ncbi:MAG: DMT family transporter [Acutalibacteraceae bacterium]|nr:DMT family transporter [Acutalibacteraceae bacterium]
MNKNNLKGSLILLLAAVIWGLAFVAQDIANQAGVQPFTLNAVRSMIGCIALIPVSAVISKQKGEALIPKEKGQLNRLLITGTVCGILLCIAVNMQQFGIASYPVEAAVSARAGFLTAMYILFVPILSIFLKKKPYLAVWTGVFIAIAGLYLLCFSKGIDSVYSGDLVMLVCAVSFACHILCVDTLGSKVDGVKLSCVQFFVCSVLSGVLMFVFEEPSVEVIMSSFLPILYLGIMSSGVAYTLQIVGQQVCDSPTLASIAMSFESVFAAVGGAVFGDIMTKREIIGCIVMFAAIVVAQLPRKKQNQ